MAKTKYLVNTAVGTFKRVSARLYSHIVVAGPTRFEVLERERREQIARDLKEAQRYRETIARGFDPQDNTEFHRDCTRRYLAEGKYAEWASNLEAAAAKLEASGPVSEDAGEVSVLGWCGRLDLAGKRRHAGDAARYRWVRVFNVVSGTEEVL